MNVPCPAAGSRNPSGAAAGARSGASSLPGAGVRPLALRIGFEYFGPPTTSPARPVSITTTFAGLFLISGQYRGVGPDRAELGRTPASLYASHGIGFPYVGFPRKGIV